MPSVSVHALTFDLKGVYSQNLHCNVLTSGEYLGEQLDLLPPARNTKGRTCVVQKLAVSLDEKELSPETGISASDELRYDFAIETFMDYGKALGVVDQINTHAYVSKHSNVRLCHTHVICLCSSLCTILLTISAICLTLALHIQACRQLLYHEDSADKGAIQ